MRKIIRNKNIEVSFDEYSGELRELTYLKTGENILQNYIYERRTPFILSICNANGEKKLLTVPEYGDISEDESLKPDFNIIEDDNGTKLLEIYYKYLKDEAKRADINVKVKVSLSADDYESIWSIEVGNNEPELVIEDVRFPFVSGAYLGDTWKDDTLIFPMWSTIKIPDPTYALSLPPVKIGWRWHDYNYTYRLGMSVPAVKNKDGSYCLETYHSGSASMNWMSYYDNEFGLYLAAYDSSFKVTTISAETFGNDYPGMGFSFSTHPHIKNGVVWISDKYGIALHPGDWHWGADRYREWRNSIINGIRHKEPEWFDKSVGLVAHYDFKYQHRFMKPVHTYSDIGRLYDEARELGLNHLLFSGWHRDGFDKGFPMYRVEPELGTEKEFSEQVSSVVNRGGHVSFYINSRLFNRKYMEELPDVWKDGAALNKNNETYNEGYGSEQFSIMCSSAKAWQSYLFNTIKYLCETIGGDGIYLDQLNCAGPVMCFDSNHEHEHDDWNKGYGKLLDDINAYFLENGKNTLCILSEGASDIHGSKMSGQLVSTFFCDTYGAFPEAYKYTFPEETLVDMIYPSRGRQIMRPVFVSKNAYNTLNRAFITGCYFWIYDLEGENSFKEDIEMREYLKNVIQLRKLWLENFGRGIYRDDRGIVCSSENITAKTYILDDNNLLLAVVNTDINKECGLVLDTEGKKIKTCSAYQLGGASSKLMAGYDNEYGNKYIAIKIKTEQLALIHIVLNKS